MTREVVFCLVFEMLVTRKEGIVVRAEIQARAMRRVRTWMKM